MKKFAGSFNFIGLGGGQYERYKKHESRFAVVAVSEVQQKNAAEVAPRHRTQKLSALLSEMQGNDFGGCEKF